MEMKAPTTTAQPQPPSGGVYPTGPPIAGGMSAHEEDEEGDEVLSSVEKKNWYQVCWDQKICWGNRAESARTLEDDKRGKHSSSSHNVLPFLSNLLLATR